MTIAQPNRQAQLTRVLRLLFLMIAIGVVFFIFFYNKMVTNRKIHRETTKLVETLNLTSSELKNQNYIVLDNKNLLATADSLGYVKETNPKYIRLDSPVAISR
ncbi:MAG: hypothetical protein WC810_27060 [Janthinobacterium sp.]|jgi:hypothetical protein